MTAQLIGLAGSVVLLKSIEATGKPENVLYVWAVNQVCSLRLFWVSCYLSASVFLHRCTMCSKHKTCPLSQVAHAWLRYKSLAVLQFDSINQKRACLLARASVKGHKLPGEKSACTSGNCLTVHHLKREGIQDQEINGIAGVLDGNQRESVLAWPSLARPSLTFASSLEDMLGSSATLLGAQVGPCTQSRLLPAAFCPPQQLRTQCTAGAGFDSKNLCNLCFRLFVIPMLTVDTC